MQTTTRQPLPRQRSAACAPVVWIAAGMFLAALLLVLAIALQMPRG